jgi:Cell morphogenesis N-terminal
MNGLMRLIWTYLYRCQESASTTTSKLDGLLKHFFPSNRTNVFPSDDHLETLTYITHFILSRHSDHGRELCLELIQESSLLALQKSGNIGSVLAPERTAIAINAVLLSFHNIEREIPTPSWPSSSDFSIVPSKDDYPTSSNYIPSSFSKPGMQEFLNRCSSALGIIALYCSKAIGHMSVFDDQWSHARLNPPHEESHNYIIRRHSDGIIVVYPTHSVPHMNLLQTCFQAWPRCLQPFIPFLDVIDILLRGVIHVEPGISEAAISALKRCMEDNANAMQVISRFNKFLYSPSHICHDSGFRLYLEFSPLRLLWVDIVDDWIQFIIRRGNDMVTENDQIFSICNDVEVGSLLLLAHNNSSINSAGVKVVRLLGILASHLSSTTSFTVPHNSFYLVERLRGKQPDDSYLRGYDDLLDKSELSRLDQWRKFKGNEVALRIVDSPNEKDRKLWRHVFPAFLQSYYVKHPGSTLSAFRESIVVVVSRYHPSISHLAGLSSRMPPGLAIRNALERDGSKLVIENRFLIDQWHIWVKILCATAILPDLSRPTYTQLGREHTRGPSDASFERERLSTTRGLFRYLTPFLDSEYVLFRDAAVLCISSFPANAYPQLLEDLSLLAGRQFYDDPRSKITSTPGLEQNFGLLATRQVYDDGRSRSGSSVMLSERNRRQERLHSAVARIYCITAHFLEHQRSFGRQAALSNILKFVRNTQVFLCAPDMRDNYFLHSLRQYFCGIVERLFDGLASLKDTDRFIPPNMHLTLYRLCEEWCQLGPQSDVVKKRQAMMQRAVESIEASDSREALQRFRHETAALSDASVRALAALSVCFPLSRIPPDC